MAETRTCLAKVFENVLAEMYKKGIYFKKEDLYASKQENQS